MERTMPKADDASTRYPDLFLAIEPIIHELKGAAGVLQLLSTSRGLIEPDELAFIADATQATVAKLEAAWEGEKERRSQADCAAPQSDATGEAQGEFVRSILELTNRWAKRFDRKDIAAWESAFAQAAQVMVEKLKKRSEPAPPAEPQS